MSKPKTIRKRAETRTNIPSPDLKNFAQEDLEKLIHELHVHQVELEMQNKELREAMVGLENSHQKYAELYDFAPVGYVTIDEHNIILEANNTFAQLVGTHKADLIQQSFTEFISQDDQDTFYLFKQSLGDNNKSTFQELRLKRDKSTPFWVRLDGNVTDDGDAGSSKFHLAIMDITDKKLYEETIIRDQKRAQILLSLFQMPISSSSEVITLAMEELIKLTGSKLGFIGFIDEEEIMMTAHLWSEKAMQECKIEKKPAQFSIKEGGLWTAPIKLMHNVVVN
ncbi:MAG: PAS domain S-box protein, partial [Bacteroidia bacterium]|nr:PAS domain S-box protein [Bacteroidia bacterium]